MLLYLMCIYYLMVFIMQHAVPKFRFLKPNIMLFYIMPRRKSYNIPTLYVILLYCMYACLFKYCEVFILLQFTRHWQLFLQMFHVRNYKPTKKR